MFPLIEFRDFRRIILAALLATFATTGHAQEGVLLFDVGRKIHLDVTIEPNVLTFSFDKHLYSYDETVIIRSVIVPQASTRKASTGGGLAGLMQSRVVDAMDGKPTISEEAAKAEGYFADFEPETKSFIKLVNQYYPDAKYVVDKSVDNGADAAARLKAKMYIHKGTIQNVTYGGKSFNLTHWVKADAETDTAPLASASAKVSILSGAKIDFEKAIFVGDFMEKAPVAFSLGDLPRDPDRRKRAMELFVEFQNRVMQKFLEIKFKLNMKRRLLNPNDIEVLHNVAVGQTHNFKKKITVDWFGEKNRINFIIAATPEGASEGLPGRPVLGEEEAWNPVKDGSTW